VCVARNGTAVAGRRARRADGDVVRNRRRRRARPGCCRRPARNCDVAGRRRAVWTGRPYAHTLAMGAPDGLDGPLEDVNQGEGIAGIERRQVDLGVTSRGVHANGFGDGGQGYSLQERRAALSAASGRVRSPALRPTSPRRKMLPFQFMSASPPRKVRGIAVHVRMEPGQTLPFFTPLGTPTVLAPAREWIELPPPEKEGSAATWTRGGVRVDARDGECQHPESGKDQDWDSRVEQT